MYDHTVGAFHYAHFRSLPTTQKRFLHLPSWRIFQFLKCSLRRSNWARRLLENVRVTNQRCPSSYLSLTHILALRSYGMRKRCEWRKRRDTNNEKHPVVVNKTGVCACVCLAFICRGWLFAWGQGLFTVLLPCRVSVCEVSQGDRKRSYILARTRDAHSLYTFYYVRLSFILVCLTNGLKNFHVVNAESHLAALPVTVWIGDLVDYITWGISCML